MKRTKRAFALGLGAVLLAASLAPAARAADPAAAAPAHAGPIERIVRCLRVLHLTESEKSQIAAILEAARPDFEALHAKFRTDRAALKAALDKTPPDPCAIGAAVLTLEADRAAEKALVERTLTAVVAVLTPEQKARFAGCMAASAPAAEAEDDAGDN